MKRRYIYHYKHGAYYLHKYLLYQVLVWSGVRWVAIYEDRCWDTAVAVMRDLRKGGK